MKLLHEVLMHAAERHPDRVALQAPGRRLTFEELAQRVSRVAGGLAELGIERGDRVAILARNGPDYLVHHYATASLGAILLVLNTRHAEPEWLHALLDAQASALVVHEDFVPKLPSLRAGCPTIRFAVGIGDAQGVDHTTDALAGSGVRADPSNVRPDDPALLIYTSGTTGRPKGALQTHRGSTTIDALTARSFEATEDDVYLAFMPYFHQAGLIRSRAVLTRGGRSLYDEGPQSPEHLARTLSKHAVSITMLVPPYDTQLAQIAARDGLNLSKLRLIVGPGGAGRRHAARMRAFCEAFDCDYLGVYGQTEVTGPATVVRGADYFANPATCGRALDGIELQVWDEAGAALPPGEIGEIMIRGETCVPGYWRNEAATQALYTEGWLHTGDLARLDERGFVYFVDRKKELIKTGGENVYPREVEDVIREHAAVADVAVLGLPDPDGWGERVAAAIVARGEAPSLDAIRDHCRGRLAGYKLPKALACVDEIPRNLTGKPLKRILRERFQDPSRERDGS
jgi:acyl-CoA synthetase (AMP-forming)/AMP-acid ligase II